MGPKDTKEKLEVTVTTVELQSIDTILPASPDIVKRTRTFTVLRAQSWRTWKDMAIEDFKSMRWLVAVRWTAIALWAFALLFMLASLSSLAADSDGLTTPSFISYLVSTFGLGSGLGFLYRQDSACQPNGNFSLYPYTYRWLSMSDFFEITIGFRPLSFTQAKVVDIVAGIVSRSSSKTFSR